MSVGLIFDIAAAVVLAVLAVRGLLRGFSGEILGLIGFFASVFCGWTFAKPAAAFLLGYLPSMDPTVAALVCGVLIFIAVSLIFAMLDGLLSAIIKAARLSLIDHVLGIFMGAVKALCLVLVIYGVLTTVRVFPTDWMNDSYVMKGAAAVWPYVRSFLEEHGILDFNSLAAAGSAA